MKEFNQLCKEFEQLDVFSYTAILAEKSMKIIPALAEVTDSGLDGVAVFSTFVLGAVAADGKLSEEEYVLCYPLFHAFFGDGITYEDCSFIVKKMRRESRELKKAVNDMVDLLGLLSEDLKDDIVLVCLMICAVDGKVSLKEKNWIKELIR